MRSLLASLLLLPAIAAAQGLATARVELREVELTHVSEAVVEAVREATVAAQIQGRIVDVRFDAGDRVKQGELMLRIDEREAALGEASGEAQVAQSQAAVENAKATYERTRNLRAQNFVSQAALDQAESTFRAAAAQLKATQAMRGQAGTQRSFTVIRAPIGGVVATRHAELGEMAAPGKPLMTVFDPGSLRVIATIPQYKLAQVSRSTRAKVEFPESGRWVEVASVTVLPTADARTHAAQARVQLPSNVEGVIPGMAARVHFVIGKASKLLAPAGAILRRGEVTAVYVLDDEGGWVLRQVRLGEHAQEGLVEVLAGLSGGERIALDPVKAGIARAPAR